MQRRFNFSAVIGTHREMANAHSPSSADVMRVKS